MTETTQLLEATFEAMSVGEKLGPVDLTVDDHLVKSFAFTVDDYHPWTLGEVSPFGGRIAPAAILIPELLRLLNTRYDPNTEAGLHQKEEVWFASPLHVGERVRLQGEFTDKYVKRGKGYIVTDAEARAVLDGRLVVRHRSIEIARVDPGLELGSGSAQPPPRRVTGEWPEGRRPAVVASPDTALATPVIGPEKLLHQDQISVFSNVQAFWRSIHTDLERAQAAGFPDTLAQGLMASMYASELGTSFFGRSWFTSGWMSMTFVKPMFAGDRLQTRAVVVDRVPEPGGLRLELEFWIENQDAVKTTLGWLSALATE